jgi:O-antigen/teichoic acid export membrane protein
MSQPARGAGNAATLGVAARGDRPTREPAALRPMMSGASLVFGGTLVWQMSNFVFNAVGAHALGPARYGVLAASLALLGFANPLLIAVQSVASREATFLAASKQVAKVSPLLHYYGLRLTCGALALGGIVAATSSWLSGLFRLGSPWPVVIVGATIPCYLVSHLFAGVLQGVERFGRFALESVVEGSAKAILALLAMVVLWRSAVSGVAAVSVSCAVGLATYLFLTLPLLRRDALSPTDSTAVAAFARDRSAHRRSPATGNPGVARYSVMALVTYGLLALMLSSDTLVAKHYLSAHQAGLYAGVSLIGKIAYFAASSLSVVAFPLFSRHHDQGLSSRRWILGTGGLVCAIAGGVVALFAIEPGWIVIPLLGARYLAAEGYVPWMAAVFGLYSLGFLVATYLLARKRRSLITVLAAALIVQLAGFFSFHSTIARMMAVLAVAFAVLVAGGTFLVIFGKDLESGSAAVPSPPSDSGR